MHIVSPGPDAALLHETRTVIGVVEELDQRAVVVDAQAAGGEVGERRHLQRGATWHDHQASLGVWLDRSADIHNKSFTVLRYISNCLIEAHFIGTHCLLYIYACQKGNESL